MPLARPLPIGRAKAIRWRARLSTVAFNVVANLNGMPAGMVSATVANQDATIELISMWVAPFARGHGVGDRVGSRTTRGETHSGCRGKQHARGGTLTASILNSAEYNFRCVRFVKPCLFHVQRLILESTKTGLNRIARASTGSA